MIIQPKLINDFIFSVDWKSNDRITFSDDIPDYVEKNINYDLFALESGATKLCIYPLDPKVDFVIKIPYPTMAGGAYLISHAPLLISQKESWDYCEAELEYYQLAQEAGIAEFFPFTMRYPAKQYPIYLQEKCISYYQECYQNISFDESPELLNIIAAAPPKYENWFNLFHPLWLLDAIKYYGLNKIYVLFDFLDKYSITDFHTDNYGYSTVDHRPLLIDFSGFYEEEY